MTYLEKSQLSLWLVKSGSSLLKAPITQGPGKMISGLVARYPALGAGLDNLTPRRGWQALGDLPGGTQQSIFGRHGGSDYRNSLATFLRAARRSPEAFRGSRKFLPESQVYQLPSPRGRLPAHFAGWQDWSEIGMGNHPLLTPLRTHSKKLMRGGTFMPASLAREGIQVPTLPLEI